MYTLPIKGGIPHLKFGLFSWVLWHINPCRLFNAESSLYIYIKYIWFCKDIFLITFETNLNSFFGSQLNDQTVLFFTIQFICSHSVLFDPYIGPYQVLLLRVRVDLGAMVMKEYSSITRASPSDCLMLYPGHSSGKSYFSAEIHSVYSTAPTYSAYHIWEGNGLCLKLTVKRLYSF